MDAESGEELGPITQTATATFKNGDITAPSKLESYQSSSSHPQEEAAARGRTDLYPETVKLEGCGL